MTTGKRVKWTMEEKKWLWECYVSVGPRGKRDGFQEKVYRRYCERNCCPLRTQQAVMQAGKRIDRGGLTEMEKAEDGEDSHRRQKMEKTHTLTL